jgi:galactokinase
MPRAIVHLSPPVVQAPRMLFVPGRLCLFGEHSDWAGGYRRTHPEIEPGHCLVVGTDQGVRGEFATDDAELVLTSLLPDGSRVGPRRIAAQPGSLREVAQSGGFFSYAAGVALEIAERCGPRGLSLVIDADLPIRKGLSSSAAVCVLAARAFGRAYGLGLTVRDEMEIAYAGERRTGSACGRMDQICAFGRRATYLRFDGERMDVESVSTKGEIHLLVVDLRREKDTRKILADLNRCFADAPGALAAGVREALGARNAKLVSRAREALTSANARALGELMTEAQSMFDRLIAPACPELRAPKLHQVLTHAAASELAFGGKGVGSQGDGCAQLVTRGAAQRTELARRLEGDLDVACLPLTIRPDA